MKLNICPTNEYTKEYYSNQLKQYHSGDAGIDLVMPSDLIVYRNSTKMVDLNIKCEAFSKDGNPISYYLRARSSISKTPMRLANAVGVIDSGYRGNIKAALDNIRDEDYIIKKGTRLLQICSPTLESIEVSIVDNVSETDRGEGGFGSTGN